MTSYLSAVTTVSATLLCFFVFFFFFRFFLLSWTWPWSFYFSPWLVFTWVVFPFSFDALLFWFWEALGFSSAKRSSRRCYWHACSRCSRNFLFMQRLQASILVNYQSISGCLFYVDFYWSLIIGFFCFCETYWVYYCCSSIAYLRSTAYERALTNCKHLVKSSAVANAALSISLRYLNIIFDGYCVPNKSFLASSKD